MDGPAGALSRCSSWTCCRRCSSRAKLPLPSDIAGRPLQVAVRGGGKPRPALAEISHRGFVAHGVRTEADKFIRRFSPADDELYFDLARDPGEKDNKAAASPSRVRLLAGPGRSRA